MKALLSCLAAGTLGAAILGALLSGCVVDGPGGYAYGGDVDVGVGVDYYQPIGVVRGGWNPDYRVGPPRDDGHHAPGGGPANAGHGGAPAGNSAPHAFRPAAPSHSSPSIPSRGRK